MNIKLIAAISINGVIGITKSDSSQSLPWKHHYSEDMKFFRKMTSGANIICGRKTFDSFPGGKPLPKRNNIVVSRNSDLQILGATVVQSIERGINLSLKEDKDKDIWIIGGSSIYAEGLKYANELFLTHINETIEGENLVYFPAWDKNQFDLAEEIKLPHESGLVEQLTVYHYIRKQ